MGFFFGGPHRRGRGWGMRGGGMGPRGFWGPPPMNMGMGYYPRRRRFYNAGRNSLFGGLALGALGYAAGKFFGGRGGNGGGFGGFGPGGMGGNGSGGSDWGGGNNGGPGFGSGGGSFDAGGGSDWN